MKKKNYLDFLMRSSRLELKDYFDENKMDKEDLDFLIWSYGLRGLSDFNIEIELLKDLGSRID